VRENLSNVFLRAGNESNRRRHKCKSNALPLSHAPRQPASFQPVIIIRSLTTIFSVFLCLMLQIITVERAAVVTLTGQCAVDVLSFFVTFAVKLLCRDAIKRMFLHAALCLF